MSNYFRIDQLNEFISFSQYAEKAEITVEDALQLAFYGELDFYLLLKNKLSVHYECEGTGIRPPAIIKPGIYRMHQDAMPPTYDLDLSAIGTFFDMGHGWLASSLNDFTAPITDFFIHESEYVRSTASLTHIGSPSAVADKYRDTPLSPKTKNSYLRIINALVSVVLNGKTGKPNTDAQAVICALESAGVNSPIDERTLANYLKEADKLVD